MATPHSEISRLRHMLEYERKRLHPCQHAAFDAKHEQHWKALRAACSETGHLVRYCRGGFRCYVCGVVDL